MKDKRLEALQALAEDEPTSVPPWTARINGRWYTVATNRRSLTAVSQRLTENREGFPLKRIHEMRHKRICRVSLTELARFLKRKHQRQTDPFGKRFQCVSVAGVHVQPTLVRKALRAAYAPEQMVTISVDKRLAFDGAYVTPRSIRVDGDGWFSLIMGCRALPTASFPEGSK